MREVLCAGKEERGGNLEKCWSFGKSRLRANHTSCDIWLRSSRWSQPNEGDTQCYGVERLLGFNSSNQVLETNPILALLCSFNLSNWLFKEYLFIWLSQLFIAARGIFHRSLWILWLWCVGLVVWLTGLVALRHVGS